MTISSLDSLVEEFYRIGAHQILCKQLAENDNNKQQIYLGSGFSAINILPFEGVTETTSGAEPTMKAPIRLSWMGDDLRTAPAPGAQLILYPGYPEVRLSGFTRGCPAAPSQDLRPIPKEQRRFDNGPDGRVLFLAILPSRSVVAYLAKAGSAMASDFLVRHEKQAYRQIGVFLEVPVLKQVNTRQLLLSELRWIHAAGWHESMRMYPDGTKRPYMARNGGGYTLEALLGILPNSKALPDYQGWEVKAFSSSRITLMTPEPDSGYYGAEGVAAFVRRYGSTNKNPDQLYFAGPYRADEVCNKTGLTMCIRGYEADTGRFNPSGGIFLESREGVDAAGWSFSGLVTHWGRKHAAAAYVPYERDGDGMPRYRYMSPVLMGEGTNFAKFLRALAAGDVVFDPGSKLDNASTSSSKVKARSQFRIARKKLASLYDEFLQEPIV
jgi:MvaI/BcnI restriction endonuclease family